MLAARIAAGISEIKNRIIALSFQFKEKNEKNTLF